MTRVEEISKRIFNKVIEGKRIISADTSHNKSLVLTLDTQEKVSLIGAANGYILYYRGDVNAFSKELQEEVSSLAEETT